MEEEETEKKVQEKRLKAGYKFLLIFVVIVVLFLGSFFFFSQNKGTVDYQTLEDNISATLEGERSEDNFVYNGYAFVRAGNLWYTQIQRGNILFNVPLHFNPLQLEDISIKGKLDDSFSKQGFVYVTFDPKDGNLNYVALTAAELSLNLYKALGQNPVAACTEDITMDCEGRPIKTCDNTDKPVIYIKKANKTGLILDGNCLTIQGNDEELIKAADRLLYQWYGVMK